jgi:hypothetical protein
MKSSRYYDRLLAPFILSPLAEYRKEANNEGRISKQEGLGQDFTF